MKDKLRVLVVDDAIFMRKAITEILESDETIEVVGTARNGKEGLEKIQELQPDVVTLDIDMPVMDGLTSIRHFMIKSPVPVVVLSSMFSDGAITFDALRLGVVDFVPKPSGAVSTDIDNAKQLIIERTKIAAEVNLKNIRRVKLDPEDELQKAVDSNNHPPPTYLIVVGTTLSGPNTVIRLISCLPDDIPAAVVVVQEISSKILPAFVESFNKHVRWNIHIAEDGSELKQGSCYIYSNEKSLGVQSNEKGEPVLRLSNSSEEPLNHLFTTSADVFGAHTIGVLLTGIGEDGASGFSRIREESGVTIAQEGKCCVYPNLTENVLEKGLVDLALNERKLPSAILQLCNAAQT